MTENPLIKITEEDLKRRDRDLLEKDIEGPVKRYAKSRYGMLAEKFISPSKRSVPDDLFTTRHGFMFFIEFKAPGKLPTPKQKEDHARRRAFGIRVYVVDDVGYGKQVIDAAERIRVKLTEM